MENPIKIDDLGVPLFLETPKVVFFRQVTFLAVAKGIHEVGGLWMESGTIATRKLQYGKKCAVSGSGFKKKTFRTGRIVGSMVLGCNNNNCA